MSMINDGVTATGEVHIELRDEHGNVKDTRHISNLVVTLGKVFIAARMKDAAATAMSHMAVGTDSTAALVANTTLGAEVAASRTALTSSTLLSNTITYAATFIAGTGTGALVEAGVFNDGTAGTMLCRTVFAVLNKGISDSVTITWAITIN